MDVFPFSTVTLTPLTQDRHGWATGGTAAVDVEWRATPRVGFGISGRYVHADLDLDETTVPAGGATVVGSLRVQVRRAR